MSLSQESRERYKVVGRHLDAFDTVNTSVVNSAENVKYRDDLPAHKQLNILAIGTVTAALYHWRHFTYGASTGTKLKSRHLWEQQSNEHTTRSINSLTVGSLDWEELQVI